jgi:glucose-induced degradation protein 8
MQGYVDAARAFAEETGTPPGADLAAIADRVAVRAALASGDVAAAVERVNDLDPAILEERPTLAFALQRQALIELARGGRAEAALEYAREYLAPRGEDDPGLLADLERAVALLAFPDPASSPLADLLSPAQRAATAGALNAAILDAQGAAGEARLPGLVRLLAWAQGRLSARGVKFPQLSDAGSGGVGEEPT